ncbi:hypothetical protein Mp_6g15860 [Marchantia polymorpha subsp. ruderalis]|uniref:Glycosyltransferase n=2 Tax=Marchantia polymorpha TaxID=3197 RepID=A0AAF6BSI1_MARPO|nr:hypothetical protein MARPO_0056s0098 [Marchantia polymorpha]BBN14965.1 hypothetical protein Mp_6g15860 [Marchantia polymorpha subsp. ruderalis]|eukprot:PTQ37649.1 hypothetical protein MARPO_0056s0098 [Marchantia polymorpha]
MVHFMMIPHQSLPHIAPMMHLADKLAAYEGVTCTIFLYKNLLEELPSDGLRDGVHILALPPMQGPPILGNPLANGEALGRVVNEYFDKELLGAGGDIEGKPRYHCLISDILLQWTVQAAARLQIPRYILSAMSAFAVLMVLHHPITKKDMERPKILHWPNIIPGPLISTFFLAKRKGQGSSRYLGEHIFRTGTCRSIAELQRKGVNMIPVGPLSSTVQPTKNFKGHSNENFNDVGDECLKWLDEQPPTSVVYVNFGTTGFTNFSIEMVHELALGLEGSEARFLWVLRPPPGLSAEEAEQVLPSGFEERVKGRGPITRDWAPQLQILEHRSTAAFLMQGGWNSTLETICRGDPFIAWATFADQPVNVKFAADGAKLGVMLPSQDVSTGLPLRVDRHDVEKAIRLVLSSEESNLIRKNAQNMKVAAAKAVSPKGSSSRSLMSFVKGLQIAEEYRHTELHN